MKQKTKFRTWEEGDDISP